MLPARRKFSNEIFVAAVPQTQYVCCLPRSENKSQPVCWSHVPTGILPSVIVFAELFRFPVHTKQIPPPAPAGLQKATGEII